MLRVAEQWADSDLGRQRQGNEDSFYVRAPLFVVADGMGGAQAGEVASATAVAVFEPGLPDGVPSEGLVRLIERANREIHDRSRADAQLAGMGTTLTAAYLAEDDAVVVAHVGDSRCYLLRDGELKRLTHDHSLVGELVARGKLTEEQAEVHPQRSVITRALGPEPQVQVDVEVFDARAGDVFLLCSDGLTSMVHEPQLAPILTGSDSLEAAGRALITAANAAGGRDNITVVLFRLEDVGRGPRARSADADAKTGEYAVVDDGPAGQSTAVHEAVPPAGQRTGTGAVAVQAMPRDRRPAPVAAPAAAAAADRGGSTRPPAREAPAAPEPRRGRGLWKVALVATVLLAMVLAGAYSASRAVYFLGTDVEDGRTVTIFRGLPYELPFGIELYQRYAGSGVTIEAVPPSRRETFTNHKLRSRDDAEELVVALERGRLNQ